MSSVYENPVVKRFIEKMERKFKRMEKNAPVSVPLGTHWKTECAKEKARLKELMA